MSESSDPAAPAEQQQEDGSPTRVSEEPHDEGEDHVKELTDDNSPTEDGKEDEEEEEQAKEGEEEEEDVKMEDAEEGEKNDNNNDEVKVNQEHREQVEGQGEESKAAAAAAPAPAPELAYSTRGRTSAEGHSSGSGNQNQAPNAGNSSGNHQPDQQWERSVREALDQDMQAPTRKETSSTNPGTSFLESLSEEERRTRTRFLPDVDGIHMLRKNEIKGDLALARSLMMASGVTTTLAALRNKHKKNKKASASSASAPSSTTANSNNNNNNSGSAAASPSAPHHDNNDDHHHGGGPATVPSTQNVSSSSAMDIDEDEATPPSEDERLSADLNSNSKGGGSTNSVVTTMQIGSHKVLLPSNAFVPPPKKQKHHHQQHHYHQETNSGGGEGGETGDGSNQKVVPPIGSPLVIESVTAFNPPRPPESIGPKKKHRMLRWERRPADVEVDLSNYRKTVHRTREELHTAELELERMESVGTHLRRHYLSHLKCLKEECQHVAKDISKIQQECVGAADLLTSRTRSRGMSSKGSYVMRDVLAILKARGSELQQRMAEVMKKKQNINTKGLEPETNDPNVRVSGIGGVSSVGLDDWDTNTVVGSKKIASSWLLLNDKVVTPMGKGVIVKIVHAHPLLDEGVDTTTTTPKQRNTTTNTTRKQQQQKQWEEEEEKMRSVVPTRVCVRLPFGTGFFPPSALSSEEKPALYSDAKLASRWKKMMETATMVAGSLDMEGMESLFVDDQAKEGDEDSQNNNTSNEDAMETEDNGSNQDDTTTNNKEEGGGTSSATKSNSNNNNKRRLLPFGSSLLTTSKGRGGILTDGDIVELEQEIHSSLYSGGGVLGTKSNPGVPKITKQAEEHRQEHFTYQARVLQLRNELYRQRRIRTLNERTLAATRDRGLRLEGLVTEMRSDLKSLKIRLDEELRELGIDEDKAESILKAYYLEQEEEAGEVSPPKRSRRLSRSEEDEMMEQEHDHHMDRALEAGGSSSGRHQHHHSSDEDEAMGDSSSGRHGSKRSRPNQ